MKHDQVDQSALFTNEIEWLRRQPGMDDWESACAHIMECMDTWIAEHTAEICGQAVAAGQAGHDDFRRRVWRCWSHHWYRNLRPVETGIANGNEVAQRIRGLARLPDSDAQGVNLIREVVLVQAALAGNEQAVTQFSKTFDEVASAATSKRGDEFARDDEWSAQLRYALLGAPNRPGKLDGFQGRGSLRSWLRTTIANELKDLVRRQNIHKKVMQEIGRAEQSSISDDPAETAATMECRELFQEGLRRARQAAKAHERAAANLVFGNGMTAAEAARVLGKHRGRVGAAVKAVANHIKAVFFDDDGRFRAKYRACAELLFHTNSAARALGMLEQVFKDELVAETVS